LDRLVPFFLVFKDAAVSVGKWIEVHSGFVSAAATVVIAAFTLTLWYATRKLWKVSQEQSRHMKTSIDITKKAANAAKANTDNLSIIERAYIFSKVELEEPINIGDVGWPQRLFVRLSLVNHGRTPAIIKEIACHVGMYPLNQVRGDDLTKKEKHFALNAFIAGGKECFEDNKPITITLADYRDMRNTKNIRTIFCFGCIKYTNIFGQDHFHGFCWEFSAPYNQFALSPNDELNYNT